MTHDIQAPRHDLTLFGKFSVLDGSVNGRIDAARADELPGGSSTLPQHRSLRRRFSAAKRDATPAAANEIDHPQTFQARKDGWPDIARLVMQQPAHAPRRHGSTPSKASLPSLTHRLGLASKRRMISVRCRPAGRYQPLRHRDKLGIAKPCFCGAPRSATIASSSTAVNRGTGNVRVVAS